MTLAIISPKSKRLQGIPGVKVFYYYGGGIVGIPKYLKGAGELASHKIGS
jgi:hypothetical protein